MAATIRNIDVTFGLVSFSASLKKASEKKDVTFDSAVRLVEGEGKKQTVRYERVVQIRGRAGVPGTSGQIVIPRGGDLVKGVWVNDDTFRPLPEAALDQIADDTRITGLEIEEFVKLSDVPWERVEGAYYLTPQKGLIGAKPMRLLIAALKGEKVAGVAKFMLKTDGRQKLGVVWESHGRLIVNLLGFADDFRDADESAVALDNVEVDRELVKMARALVASKTVEESPLLNGAVDEAVAARTKLYEDALEGEPVVSTRARVKPAEAPNDLMAQLERSLAGVT